MDFAYRLKNKNLSSINAYFSVKLNSIIYICWLVRFFIKANVK